ncbi:voltage-gated chloride channel family protein [Halosquirtibacter xylanolyticus]|uniref:voltage-gated chloride channel family protein n=1 Tax=Halosquirtibacter xylanolyticus TaxID=3374599 RepID=UPI003748A392|nr:voltage-gated chloride channel family protein [Prolixibacteraceae bacterium]
MFEHIKGKMSQVQQVAILGYLIKWLLLSLLVGLLAGAASAFFLKSLHWATDFRNAHMMIVFGLPIGGLAIGLMYYYWGEGVVKGNNLLLEEFHSPKKIIQLRMAPLVLIGTVITHLFGGSAGREGTAVQMGGAIADQFTKWLKLDKRDRRILLSCGVAAGFASVFGTPLAGAIFALEVFTIGRMRYDTIVPSVLAAVFADYGCRLFNVHHTHYEIFSVPSFEVQNFLWVVLAGVFCGLAGMLFSKGVHFWGDLFKKINYPPLRPVVGGVVLALVIWGMNFDTKYIGLGVPTIVDSFSQQMNWYDFLVKILFTTFTLGAGFKGGEVTPLFFVGATLGSALSFWIPLPISLLAGVCFVAVFSGATNTPIACTMMGIELFGAEAAVYIAIACVIAYLFSGHSSIYSAQIVGSPKHWSYEDEKGKTLSQIDAEKKN